MTVTVAGRRTALYGNVGRNSARLGGFEGGYACGHAARAWRRREDGGKVRRRHVLVTI